MTLFLKLTFLAALTTLGFSEMFAKKSSWNIEKSTRSSFGQQTGSFEPQQGTPTNTLLFVQNPEESWWKSDMQKSQQSFLGADIRRRSCPPGYSYSAWQRRCFQAYQFAANIG